MQHGYFWSVRLSLFPSFEPKRGQQGPSPPKTLDLGQYPWLDPFHRLLD